MCKTTSALLALCALAGAAGRADGPDPEPPADAKAELKKLQGTWTVTKMLAKGDELMARAGTTYTFDGDRLTRAAPVTGRGERKQTFKVKVDTRKRPHKIVLIPEGAKTRPVAIYKIEKGELY